MINSRRSRQSNLELLRIVAMLIIVSHHCCYYSGINLNEMAFSFPKIFLQSMSLGGFGINLFVLVSGYFMVTTQFKARRIVKTWLEVLFYSLFIYLIMVCIQRTPFEFVPFMKSIFPVVFEQYWFATSYIILMLLSPFINIFLKFAGQRVHLALVLVLTLVFCVIPTVTTARLAYSDVVWFVTLYLIATYIRLYPNSFTNSMKKNLATFVVSMLVAWASVVFIDALAIENDFFMKSGVYMLAQNKLPILTASIGLFLVFKNINIASNKVINAIASTTFGIYLIHDNSYMRSVFWREIFRLSSYADKASLPIVLFAMAAFVFAACMLIDFIRQYLFERPFFTLYDHGFKWLHKLNDSIRKSSARLFDRFLNAK